MKRLITILLLLFSLNSFAARVPFNSLGTIERKTIIKFSPEQINELITILLNKRGAMESAQFPSAYEYIYSELKKMKADEATLFWFDKASHINEGTGSSSYMIRTYTKIGLNLAHRKVQNLQKVSDDIARNVLGDVLRHRGVLPLQNILAKDISSAMKVAKIKDLAGWGGSFYYWHMPLVDAKGRLVKDSLTKKKNDYLTVGDAILRDNDQVKRFVMTFILTVTSTPYTTALSDAPGLYRALLAIDLLPDIVRLPIIRGIKKIDPMMGESLTLFLSE